MGQPQITQADAIGSPAHRAPGYTLGTAPIQQFGGARHAAPASMTPLCDSLTEVS